MNTIDSLCIALSLRKSDGHLLRYGKMLVELGIARTVRFVHVIPRLPDSQDKVTTLSSKLRNTVCEAFNPDGLPADCSTDILLGPREDCLLEFLETNQVGLVLVGHSAHESSGKRALAIRLAMASSASVWLVPEDSAEVITKVLAPVDFSSHSADSLAIATGVTQRAGLAECTALHVYYDESVHRFDDHDLVTRGNESMALEQFVKSTKNYGVNVVSLVEEGSNVARTINRIATEQGFDLIVLNTRGRSKAASVLLGSETSQVVMESRVPVLTIKHQGAQLKFLKALTSSKFWHKSNQETN